MNVVMNGRYGVRYVVVHDVNFKKAQEVYMYMILTNKKDYFINLDVDSISMIDTDGTVFKSEAF